MFYMFNACKNAHNIKGAKIHFVEGRSYPIPPSLGEEPVSLSGS